MAKRPTIIELTSSYGSQTALNTSLTNLRNGFDNTLSRDGSAPNNMQADLDMDGNKILNADHVFTERLTIDGVRLYPGEPSFLGPVFSEDIGVINITPGIDLIDTGAPVTGIKGRISANAEGSIRIRADADNLGGVAAFISFETDGVERAKINNTEFQIDNINITNGTGTFSSLTSETVNATTRLRCTADIPILELAETDAGNSTHNRNRISRDANIFRISTVADNGTNVSNDYEMNLVSSGALNHIFRTGGFERCRVDSLGITVSGTVSATSGWQGNLEPLNTGTQNLGSNSFRWITAFLVSSPNVSSDARLKENIRDLNEAEKRAAAKIKVRTFTMKEGGQRKIGYIAQEIIEAMDSEGLCAFEYGLVTDGEHYGVDYDAVNAFKLG